MSETSSLSVTLTIPLEAKKASEAMIASINELSLQLSTEQLSILKLALDHSSAELGRRISEKLVIEEREYIEKLKLAGLRSTNKPKKSPEREKELKKLAKSPQAKAQNILSTLYGLSVQDFVIGKRMFCMEHKMMKHVCGCNIENPISGD